MKITQKKNILIIKYFVYTNEKTPIHHHKTFDFHVKSCFN